MNRKLRRQQILLLVSLIVIATIVQCFTLFSIAKEKKDNRKQDALIYGRSIAASIELTMENSLNSSYTLKHIYDIYGEDCFKDFEEIGRRIMDHDPVISSLYIAPDAVIRTAYPAEVGASTIGFAMLEDPQQGPRAQLAIDTREVTVAGPHELVEGGKGLIIRNPLFKGDEFVGFTIIVLDWDRFVEQLLANTSVSSENYKFAIWKEDHDSTAVSDEYGYILRNTEGDVSKEVDIELSVPNDIWHLVVEPVEGWNVIGDMKNQILLSVLFTGMVIFIIMRTFTAVQRKAVVNEQIRIARQKDEYMAKLAVALKAAEDANNAKTVFLNNMSHDIRTPMNAIMGYTDLMGKVLDDRDKLKEYLSKIRMSGDYLLQLINNVLEVARIDSGKESVDESFTDLTDPKCTVIPLLENEFRKKDLTFTTEMDIRHRYVYADMHKIREINMNLMSNAIKYTPRGGSIHMFFHEIPCDRDGYAAYENVISDNGIGMSEEFRKHLFDLFSRERNTTESGVIGSGLGMSIVKKLVDLMDGTIQVKSELGKGTTFIVTLMHRIAPDPTKSAGTALPAEANTVDLKGKCVLLAEDNDLNAEIASAILEDLGIKVERAEDGVVCLDMLRNAAPEHYDLILMDIQMPRLNGYETAERIRAAGNMIPIAAMTANAFEEDKRSALAAGMNAHLAKPIDVPVLIETLRKLL